MLVQILSHQLFLFIRYVTTYCHISLALAAVRRYEGHGSQKDKQEQLKQAHAAQVRALQDEHRRQQEELLQVRVLVLLCE